LTKLRKLFVVGATGYIGSALYKEAKLKFITFGTSSSVSSGMITLDLNSPSIFDYKLIGSSDIVLIVAAIPSPDICAREFDRAWATNVTGTSKFIEKVIERGGKVIFFSSDTVYGERSNNFNEDLESKPAGEYAEMKSEVENFFLASPLFKSIRLSYVFSCDDNFTKYLLKCAEGDQEADIFHPFYRSIIHRDDVIKGVMELASQWDIFPQKIINFGGGELLSRIDFAETIKNFVLPNLKYQVTKPNNDFFENRPRIIAMKSNILPKLLGRPAHTLAEAVRIEFNRVV
jgi:dTDP-4-dehydrorhamnose reductase